MISQDSCDAPNGTLIRVTGLVKHFPVRKGFFGHAAGRVRAVDGVDFTIREGETLGLAGESGCGKTTTGRLILRLLQPTAGSILYRGRTDLATLPRSAVKPYRREMQIIFQDPFSSLNPRMTVESALRNQCGFTWLAKGRAVRARVVQCWNRWA
jgi:ABC-type glutathione transport system ATPase component